MANKYDDADGVWRTIGGRKVFIRTGQSLSDAMKESGKFKSAKKKDEDDNKPKKEEYIEFDKKMQDNIDRVNKEYDEELTKARELGDDKLETQAREKRQTELKKYQDMKNENLENYKRANAEWKAQAQKMEKNYEEFGANTVDDEKRLNDLSKERDIAQSKLTPKEVQDANKDGKYFRDRLLELDKEDTPTGTYDIETGEAVDFKGKGYSVSFEQTGVQLNDDEYLAKINECRGRCDGNVYFGKYGGTPEVSFHTDDINEAMKIMKENNQYSIYDIANDTEIVNDEYDASTNQIKDLSQTKATNDNLDLTKANDRFLAKAQAYYDKENGKLSDEEYNKKLVDIDSNAGKSSNETMNKAIREKASKKSTFKDDLPKHTEIKTQGTSNRKEVSENIQAHILDHYDSPQDFIEQMDAYDWKPTLWHRGEALAEDGFYDIYYEDQRKFLDDLKINPKGKEFSDDKVFQTYKSLIGRESAKLYDRLMKNEFNKYKQSHPLTKMTLEEFIKSRKER